MTIVLAGSILLGLAGCGGPAVDRADDPDGSGRERIGVFGTGPLPSGGIPAVVTLTPADVAAGEAGPVRDTAASAVPPTRVVDQFGLQFSPMTALVRVGGTVSFTNSESALAHNVQVRSASGGPALLDEDAVAGDRIDLTLPEAGGYDVTCEMHPGMTAFVYVTDAPYAVFTENDGSYRLEGVPPGRYEIRIWSIDPERRSSGLVEVGDGATEVPPLSGTNAVG